MPRCASRNNVEMLISATICPRPCYMFCLTASVRRSQRMAITQQALWSSLGETTLTEITEAQRVHLQLQGEEITPSCLNAQWNLHEASPITNLLLAVNRRRKKSHLLLVALMSLWGGVISTDTDQFLFYTKRRAAHVSVTMGREKEQRSKNREKTILPDVKPAVHLYQVFFCCLIWQIQAFFNTLCRQQHQKQQHPVKTKQNKTKPQNKQTNKTTNNPAQTWFKTFFFLFLLQTDISATPAPRVCLICGVVLTQFKVIYFWEGVVRISGICELLRQWVLIS